jgi:hypothetical protein
MSPRGSGEAAEKQLENYDTNAPSAGTVPWRRQANVGSSFQPSPTSGRTSALSPPCGHWAQPPWQPRRADEPRSVVIGRRCPVVRGSAGPISTFLGALGFGAGRRKSASVAM